MRPARAAAALLLASAVLIPLGFGSAFAAGEEGEEEEKPPVNPVEVAIPYEAEFEAGMAGGWTIANCKALSTPAPEIGFTCEADKMTFTADEYDPKFEEVVFPVQLRNGGQRLTVNYRVSMAPPLIPAVPELVYAYPFPSGSRILLPLSDLNIACEGCAEDGPKLEILEMLPADVADAWATRTHIEIATKPGYTGTIALAVRATDPFKQKSQIVPLTVNVYAAGETSLTALHVVVHSNELTEPIDLAELVNDSAGEPVTFLGCGLAVLGTAVCDREGLATFTPAADSTSADQFSFHVLSAAGEQATGSVTVIPSDLEADWPAGILPSSAANKKATVIPVRPVVEEEDAVAAGLFAPLKTVLDRVTGRADTKGKS
ncbi:hypothetical protein EYE40_15270 [Glaciihabitans arcticus]|uniref:Uncharacterized protein n=1 Tax=Glaciihabitans arcticus TaxID=2668039 RepID=A0A4Q9GUN7_9MICO|nr:hypothetical protein [Glaciihabitans arcticus]TBN55557.1 hypothetical protein EYE40_15270 [Glaciihabitans arcticus]